MRLCMIGNSQMFYHDLPRMLADLSMDPQNGTPPLTISTVLQGGASLASFWAAGDGEGTARALIAEGQWDAVVIQEIYSAERKSFETHAALFNEAIRAAGARTVLFATAQVSEAYDARYAYPESFRRFNDMQRAFGAQHGISVATAGYAWMRYLGEHPTDAARFGLYHPDKGHPGFTGTYIYACMLYAALFNTNPLGLPSACSDLPENKIPSDEARAMQQAAWDQWRADRENLTAHI